MPECPDEAKFVYVLDSDQNIYRFDPAKLLVTKLGTIDCPHDAKPGPTPQPVALAVDRSGTAWIQYSDSDLFTVGTKDLVCKKAPYVATPAGRVFVGMAFVSDSPGSKAETLFVTGFDFDGFDDAGVKINQRNWGIGHLNLTKFDLTLVGEGNGEPVSYVTGTGDGRLFASNYAAPEDVTESLGEVDKTTGRLSNQRALGIATPYLLRVAFWGGDFWIFTPPTNQQNSAVWQAKGSGDVVQVIPTLGFFVGGVAASTCAPLSVN